ncbi:MAG: DUF1015 domain-containing protein [Cyclobacteriaceae bacterium]|nr:DUF1015 domain-containing protein [Cyclobacteriaceae bacterium]
MAEILPLKAWLYNDELKKNIESLTSPLFDVVSEKQRKKLYKNDLNSIHLSVPVGNNPSEKALKTLTQWKNNNTIVQDTAPGIYVYYQYFTLHGNNTEICRKGFICNIKAYDWSEKVILRHENTMPKSVNDRIDLLNKTQLNVSPTHGLYTDPNYILESYMDEAIKTPIFETEDYQGVRDVMAVINDPSVVQKFIQLIEDKKIILADGHHRYEGSLEYRKSQKAKNPNHTGNEGYNYHMMYLTNTETDNLRVLPTHRMINGLSKFNEDQIIKSLSKYFIIKEIEDAFLINEIILGKKWAFGLLFKNSSYKLRLKPEVHSQLSWPFSDEIKQLDLTVMHYFIIEKVLNILGKEQRYSENILFDRSFADCLTKVIQNDVQLAIITNGISMEDIKKVCHSGYTMPQKSTYFYPKVICGFLFSSIKKGEFYPSLNS